MKTRFFRKAVSMLTAAVIAFSSIAALSAVPAAAVDNSALLEEGYISYHHETEERYGGLISAIAEGLNNVESSIDVSSFGFIYDQNLLSEIMTIVIYTHPQLFYATGGCSISGYYDSNKNIVVSAIRPSYSYDAQTCVDMRREFEEVSLKYLAKVNSSMTDFEIAAILHDEIALRTYYDIDCEIYDTMVNGKGKCYGYSEVYSYLLGCMGIKSEIVTSDEMFHQWNKVCIDGSYYNVDVTWDDPTEDKPGHVEHKCFLVSDEMFQDEAYMGNFRHYDYYEGSYYQTSTAYDEAYFHNTNTQMCYVDGAFYFINNEHGSTDYQYIVKYDEAADEAEQLYYLNHRWLFENGGNWYYYLSSYSSLAEKNGFLYFNTSNCLYAYNLKTNTVIPFTDENAYDKTCYGLRILDDGGVYAVLTDDVNTTGTLERVGDALDRWGDLTSDGLVNISDATEIQRHIAAITTYTGFKLTFCDYNADNSVDINDVTDLQKHLAGVDY